MRSRLTTYMLIVAVAILWGIIIRKVFFSKAQPLAVKETQVRSVEKDDSARTLALDYRDPFLPKQSSVNKPVSLVKKETAGQKPPPATEDKITFNYIGSLRCGKVMNYIIESANAQYTLSPGEQVDGIRLLKVFPDSLVLGIRGKRYTLLRDGGR